MRRHNPLLFNFNPCYMHFAKILLTLFFLSFLSVSYAQQIKDGETVDLDGLGVTFRIVNKEAVDVKGQSFDRYKVVAAVKNNTGKSINVRLKSAPDLAALSAAKIVELNCVNATGARLTSKKLDVSMNSHQLKVTYLSRDKDGKLANADMTVTAGYFLDEGQTAENDAIFIVPKGEAPQVSVRKL